DLAHDNSSLGRIHRVHRNDSHAWRVDVVRAPVLAGAARHEIPPQIGNRNYLCWYFRQLYLRPDRFPDVPFPDKMKVPQALNRTNGRTPAEPGTKLGVALGDMERAQLKAFQAGKGAQTSVGTCPILD